MHTLRSLIFAFLLFPFLACGVEFTFPTDNDQWSADFTDYPVNEESFYELAWGWENLPYRIVRKDKTLEKGIFLSGNNHSDDLFMFARRRISQLKANTWYALDFSVTIESNVAEGTMGIGGSPGESLFFKVGASTEEPKKVAVDGFYRLSVDKGDQGQDGKNARVIGDLANPDVDQDDPQYLPKKISSRDSLLVKSNSKGELWIFLGTDSGFEGRTKYYIAEVVLQVEESGGTQVFAPASLLRY